MEPTIKVTYRGTRKVVSERVFEGYTPQPAYCPEHLGRLSKAEIEAIYMENKKYQQTKSNARKEELWAQIMENRAALKDIVLTTRYNKELPLQIALQECKECNKEEIPFFIKSLNAINKLVNSIFTSSKTPYSQVQQMKLA